MAPMDINTLLLMLADEIEDGDRNECEYLLGCLDDWTRKQGFPPKKFNVEYVIQVAERAKGHAKTSGDESFRGMCQRIQSWLQAIF